MRTFKLPFLIMALAASACQESEPVSQMESNKTPETVSFTTLSDRASGSMWAAADAIGVYMFVHGGTLAANGYSEAVNKQYQTVSGDGCFEAKTAADAIAYPYDARVDFVAYYPFNENVADRKYPVDVTDQSDLPAIDLLYATTTEGYDYQSDAVPLTFKHMLSNVKINLYEKRGNDLTGVTVAIEGMKRKAAFSLADGTFAANPSSQGDIELAPAVDATDIFKASCQALIIPTAPDAGHKIKIEVPSTGKTFTWEIPASKEFNPGIRYGFDLELNSSTGEIALLEDVSEWEPSEMIVEVVATVNTPLAKIAEGIYEGDVELGANTGFKIAIDGVEHGFVMNSGHGGVGMISTAYTSADCGILDIFSDYSVDKSFGRLSASGNDLWHNTGAAGTVKVKVDLTADDEIPRYYLTRVATPDPSLLLEEKFDLITWGGGWQAGKSARGLQVSTTVAIGTRDGSEVAAAKANNVTPHGPMATANADNAAFIANAGLAGWDLKEVYIWYGMIMVNNTVAAETGHAISPALASLTGPTDITVEFDMLRFASTGNAIFSIEGEGTIASASYHDVIEPGVTYATAYNTNKSSSPTAITTTPGDKSLTLTSRSGTDAVTAGISPSFASASSSHSQAKYMTRLTVSVTGATGTTRLKWTSEGAANTYRYCLDNVRVTK